MKAAKVVAYAERTHCTVLGSTCSSLAMAPSTGITVEPLEILRRSVVDLYKLNKAFSNCIGSLDKLSQAQKANEQQTPLIGDEKLPRGFQLSVDLLKQRRKG